MAVWKIYSYIPISHSPPSITAREEEGKRRRRQRFQRIQGASCCHQEYLASRIKSGAKFPGCFTRLSVETSRCFPRLSQQQKAKVNYASAQKPNAKSRAMDR